MTEGRTLILGLGNPILGDDGVGIAIAREIKTRWLSGPAAGSREEAEEWGKARQPRAGVPEIDVIEASLAGRFLLDLITGYRTVVVADAIITDEKAPVGSVHKLSVEDLGRVVNPYASHAIDLRTTVEFGKQLGYEMPETILIYAVEIKENTVFREGLTPEVAATVVPVAREIMAELGRAGSTQ